MGPTVSDSSHDVRLNETVRKFSRSSTMLAGAMLFVVIVQIVLTFAVTQKVTIRSDLRERHGIYKTLRDIENCVCSQD